MGNCFPIILSSIFTQLIVFIYFLHHLSDEWGTKKKVPVIADENFPLPKGRGVVQNKAYHIVQWSKSWFCVSTVKYVS